MSKINASLDKKRSTKSLFYRFLLIIYLSLNLFPRVFGQEELNAQKPFKKCWEYGSDNGLIRIVASDNKNKNIIISKSNSLISFDTSNKSEIWKTEINGTLEYSVISDQDSLFFITSSKVNDKEKNFSLNSISLKTGITKWQRKTISNSDLKTTDNSELLILNDKSDKLYAIRKTDGTQVWEKEVPTKVASLEFPAAEQINLLSETQFLKISAKTGEKLKETKITNGATSSHDLKGESLVLGYSTGEIIKLMPVNGDTLWRFKTGGNVSNLTILGEDVLATSFDNFVYFFSGKSGKLKWKRRVGERINLTPVVFQHYAMVGSSSGNILSIIDIENGKVINQIGLESDNLFLETPIIQGDILLVQTRKGIYAFSNSGC